jgi:hypothetical protein
MERFHDITCHAYKFVIRREWMHVPRHEVIDGPHSIAQTEQKCYRGISGKVPWGERFSSSKLHHDAGKHKREVTQVLLGWSRS